MLKVLSYILCDLDPKVKVIGQKAGICDGVPSTSALVSFNLDCYTRFFVRKIGYIKFVPKSVTFLVIVSSPKPLDVSISNFVDA